MDIGGQRVRFHFLFHRPVLNLSKFILDPEAERNKTKEMN